ncbi:hypothetical protein PAJ_0036 [Pantoea ananatis AJ13355]|uniref:Uncharacterized protein n=1 Tax=Pantoea ananatis (strain AJ13355) TaxID=932677 RepID=A0A0H3KSG3_PANAA|nr:hypothetical protein PAJ_0036 [Pantoea ananatis AJ13355]
MLQGFWHDDKYAFSTACQQLLLDDHAGFDGFPQADLIREQDARRMAAAYVVGDMQLVGDQIGTHAAQAADGQAILLTLIFTCAKTQGEAIHTVELACKQPVLRFAEHQFAVEHHFTQHDVGFFGIKARADIGYQVIVIAYFIDLHLPAFVAGNGITRIKNHAGDRRVAASVEAIFPCGREQQGDHARINRHHGA